MEKKTPQSQSPDEQKLNDSIIPHLDYLQHFHSGYFAITIQVIHVEGPVEFLLKATPGGDGQGANELSEVDGPIAIFVKRPKRMLSKLGSITIWEKLQFKNEKNKSLQ